MRQPRQALGTLATGLFVTLLSVAHAVPPRAAYRGHNGLVRAKGLHPLTHFGLGEAGNLSHEAKIDFRFVVPLLLRPFDASFAATAVIFALCGVVTFTLLAEELRRSDVERTTAVFALGGVAATAAGGVFFLGLEYFDAVAIALSVGAGFVRRRILAGALAFVALYTDERALVALTLSLLAASWLDRDRAVRHPRGLSVPVLAASVGAYGATRIALDVATDLRTASGWVGPDVMRANIAQWPSAVLLAFAVWWVVLGTGLWLAAHRRRLLDFAIVGAAALAIVAAIMVFDVTRSLSYLLPIVPVPIVAIARRYSVAAGRRLFGAALVACAVVPAYVFAGPGVIHHSLPVQFLQHVGLL